LYSSNLTVFVTSTHLPFFPSTFITLRVEQDGETLVYLIISNSNCIRKCSRLLPYKVIYGFHVSVTVQFL